MLQCWRTCERIKYMKLIFYKNRHQLLLGVVTLLLIIVVSFIVNVKKSDAILGFGGVVQSFIACPESANYAILISGYPSGYFMWEPTTISHLYGSQQLFSAGAWALATYTPVGVCVISVVPPVTLAPVMGTMIRVGTSLTPI